MADINDLYEETLKQNKLLKSLVLIMLRNVTDADLPSVIQSIVDRWGMIPV